MPKFKSQSIIEFLSEKSNEDINFVDEDQYSEDLQKKFDEEYELLAFQSKNPLGHDLLSFAKLKFESSGKFKFTLLKTSSQSCDGNTNEYHTDDPDYGEDFGLKYSEDYDHFYSESIDFFGGSFGADVYFEKLGVNKLDPEYNIDIKADWSDLDGDIFVGSDGEAVVYIDGKNIYSKVPIEVKGNSTKWKLTGNDGSSQTLTKTFEANPTSC